MKVIFILLLLIPFAGFSQEEARPQVGKPCPAFVLDRVTHYSKSKVTPADFRGKWLFLDFWSSTCISCLKSFPKIDALQAAFKDEIQFLLVGMNDKKHNGNIEDMFERLRKKRNLDLAVAYDSVLLGTSGKWGIHSVPTIIIIDPQGMVRHITNGVDMTPEKLTDLIAGKQVSFSSHLEGEAFDPDTKPGTLTNSHQFIIRSVLERWNGEAFYSGFEMDIYVRHDPLNADHLKVLQSGWTAAMIPLYALYNYAYIGRWDLGWTSGNYYGEFFPKPVLEMKDTSLFVFDYINDIGKGYYNYNILLPVEKMLKQELIMKGLQNDLQRAFGYEAYLETRPMPVWKLIAKPGVAEKLKAKSDKVVRPWDNGNTAAGFTAQNIPVKECINALIYLVSDGIDSPFIDATGIDGNIDFSIDADMTDMNDIKKELQKQGLDFVKGKKKMKVLVIRDPKN